MAAVSKHRLWFAVREQQHKDAVRLTPGAGRLLFTGRRGAPAAGQRPLFDVFVDEQTWRASPRLAGSWHGGRAANTVSAAGTIRKATASSASRVPMWSPTRPSSGGPARNAP